MERGAACSKGRDDAPLLVDAIVSVADDVIDSVTRHGDHAVDVADDQVTRVEPSTSPSWMGTPSGPWSSA